MSKSKPPVWRTNPKAAGEIINGLFAGVSPSELKSALEILAESTAFARRLNPHRWVLNLHKKNVRLITGLVMTLQFRADKAVTVLVAKALVDTELMRGAAEYVHAPACAELELLLERFLQLWPTLRAAHHEAIRICVEAHAGSGGHRRAHSPGAVEFLDTFQSATGTGIAIREVLDGITRDHLIAAIAHLESGESHRFSESTKYDVLYKGVRYPPKAVVGIAGELASGRPLGPEDFSGGVGSKCFRVLKEHGFVVLPKAGSDSDEWEDDLAEEELRQRTQLGPTELDQLIKARRGQGVYRENLQGVEKSCRVTGLSDRRHLRASHIKPWRDCDDRERLDGFNGLLLSPHVDHLFDHGHISFSEEGDLLVSKHLNPAVLKRWGLAAPLNVGAFSAEQRGYLAYHREMIFEKDAGGRRSG